LDEAARKCQHESEWMRRMHLGETETEMAMEKTWRETKTKDKKTRKGLCMIT
jgi:hypothetical protein